MFCFFISLIGDLDESMPIFIFSVVAGSFIAFSPTILYNDHNWVAQNSIKLKSQLNLSVN